MKIPVSVRIFSSFVVPVPGMEVSKKSLRPTFVMLSPSKHVVILSTYIHHSLRPDQGDSGDFLRVHKN